MKADKAPEKIILSADRDTQIIYDEWVIKDLTDNIKIEYTRTDAFIEKARKWFEKYNEWFDLDGSRHCDMENFENFKKAMKL